MLKEQIRRDWIAARKKKGEGDSDVIAALLGTLLGTLDTKGKNLNPTRDLTDAEIIAEVKKMLDSVQETGRLLAKDDPRQRNIRVEMVALQGYMPAQMSEEDITSYASQKRNEGMNMGQIMSALKAEHPGEYDGKLAAGIVKRLLA